MFRLTVSVATLVAGAIVLGLVMPADVVMAEEMCVVGWTIESNTPGSIPATYRAAGVTDIPLSRGPGISPRPDVGAFYISRYWNYTSGRLDLNDYYQWGFSCDHPLDLLYIGVSARGDSVHGPTTRRLYASFDGGDFVYVGRPATTSARFSVDLSEYTDVRSTVFRLYAYNAKSAQGNLRINNELLTPEYAQAIQVFATPEPATLSLLALGGLAMIRRRRIS
jgi:hypothetical protein